MDAHVVEEDTRSTISQQQHSPLHTMDPYTPGTAAENSIPDPQEGSKRAEGVQLRHGELLRHNVEIRDPESTTQATLSNRKPMKGMKGMYHRPGSHERVSEIPSFSDVIVPSAIEHPSINSSAYLRQQLIEIQEESFVQEDIDLDSSFILAEAAKVRLRFIYIRLYEA
jgi:hypothetical protein